MNLQTNLISGIVILSIVLLLSPAFSSSSDSLKIVELINTYNELSYKDSTKANQAIEKAILLAKKQKEYELWLEALNTASRVKLMKNQQVAAKSDIDQALSLRDELGDNVLFTDTYTNLGLYYFYHSEYLQAITQHIAAADIAEKFSNKLGMARNYNNIGNVYIKLRDYEKALSYYQRAYEIAKKENMKNGMAHVLGNLGIVYKNLGLLDSAIYVISQSLEIHKAMESPYQVALNYSSLGGLYWDLHQYDSARYYFQKYLDTSENIDNQHGKISALLNLSEIALEENDPKSGMQYLSGLDTLVMESENMEFKQKLYELRSMIYERSGNYEVALANWKLAEQWKDSIAGKDLKAEIEDLEIKYQSAQKEKAILRQQAQLEEKENQLIIVVSFAGFILICSLFSIYIYRQRRENKYKTESIKAITEAQENERQRVARDLHDSVGSMLANLKNKLSTHGDTSEELEMLTHVNKEIRQISHNMMPGSLKRFGLAAAIKSELEMIEQNTNIKTSFTEFGLNGKLSEDTEIHLYRIVQESIQNITKHANATIVNVSVTSDQRSLNMIVEDNGKGINYTSGNEGLGIRNIRTRVELLRGKLQIDSHPKVGTTLNINIPVS